MASGSDRKQGASLWSSRTAFILASIGSAVGLGNLWRFPSEAGTNGGGAFVIFYLFCVALIGVPILLSEMLIGRHGRGSAIASARNVARESGRSDNWAALAGVGMAGSFFILPFYSVVAGWVLYYVGQFAADIFVSGPFSGAFANLDREQIQGLMPALFANGPLLIGLHALFMAITIFVVARGVHGGIEKVALWLMPGFFVLLLAVTLYAIFTGAMGEAFAFLFTFAPERLFQGPVMLSALGQAFFSLSLGSAMMITYGAYANRETNLAGASAVVAAADSGVAIIAGLAIFPVVFAAGLDVAAGPTLMFQTLPASFHSMAFGSVVGFLFFVMVFFAALTSSVALLEATTSWTVERFGLARPVAAISLGLVTFLLGITCALSFSIMSDFKPLPFGIFDGLDMFGILDTLTGKILLPLSGLLTAIFIGWRADKALIDSENGLGGAAHIVWRFLIAWLCPIAVGLILIVGLFPGLLG